MRYSGYLLDTCTFLWCLQSPNELSSKAAAICQSYEENVYVSVASYWEASIKYYNNRLPLPVPPKQFFHEEMRRLNFSWLPLEAVAIDQYSSLPRFHQDPFDRILVCQAIAHQLVLVSDDSQITRYPVPIAWK